MCWAQIATWSFKNSIAACAKRFELLLSSAKARLKGGWASKNHVATVRSQKIKMKAKLQGLFQTLGSLAFILGVGPRFPASFWGLPFEQPKGVRVWNEGQAKVLGWGQLFRAGGLAPSGESELL